jgi:hypothetical protein
MLFGNEPVGKGKVSGDGDVMKMIKVICIHVCKYHRYLSGNSALFSFMC